MSDPRYDTIGRSYASTRAEDPRIAAAIRDALGDARTVLNVGAGTGSYEPPDRAVTAVEPSPVMRAQRPPGAAPCIEARAESLPFEDDTFDAAMAIFSDHHWGDRHAGLRELRRVGRRALILNWEPRMGREFWLTRDYIGEFADFTRDTWQEAKDALGATEERIVPVPHDCADGFLLSFWRRPAAYLDPLVRANISVFAMMDPAELDAFVERLGDDLKSGAWAERNAAILELDELDVGLRIAIAA